MQKWNTYISLFAVIFTIISCKNGTEIKPSSPESTTETISESALANTEYTYIAALSGMNMRASPDQKGEIILLVPYGKQVEVLGKTDKYLEIEGIVGEWYKIKFNEKEGYVFSGFLLNFQPPTSLNSTGFENYLSNNFKSIEKNKHILWSMIPKPLRKK
jgi:uncharacterized protein YgiM (DUF1202 family)